MKFVHMEQADFYKRKCDKRELQIAINFFLFPIC